MTAMATATYAARTRLVKSGRKGWSLAILVPTKKMTRLVSDALRVPPAHMQEIPHEAAVELEGAILAAEVIALLMQPGGVGHFEQLIALLCNYFHGKGEDTPAKGDLAAADSIHRACDEWAARQGAGRERSNSILVAMRRVYGGRCR
jgi:DNA helicase-2/ATP-dependent DNA helicase PcrA